MRLNRKTFSRINQEAQQNPERAAGMLDIINEIFGTEYFLMNRRVTYEAVEDGKRVKHDAWVWAY